MPKKRMPADVYPTKLAASPKLICVPQPYTFSRLARHRRAACATSARSYLKVGFGVKTLGRPDPVDADTLFLAVSNTKAMTTLLLAELVDEHKELVDEHKLRWDELVTEAYPEFRLGDANTAGTGEAPGVRMHRTSSPGF
jgi:CubicO group peptidase (beta-lactamase class C family)